MAAPISQVPIRKAKPPMITGPLPIPTAVLIIIQITLEIRPPSSPLRRFAVMLSPHSYVSTIKFSPACRGGAGHDNDNRHDQCIGFAPKPIDPGSSTPGPVVLTGYGYGTVLGLVRGHEARMNPGDLPGYQTLLAYLPDQDLDLAVLCNEEAPSVTASLTALSLS